jgi:hypothetical protein
MVKKTAVYIYFSHGKKEYSKKLLSLLRKQLMFQDNDQMVSYFDCSFDYEDYVRYLKDKNIIESPQINYLCV